MDVEIRNLERQELAEIKFIENRRKKISTVLVQDCVRFSGRIEDWMAQQLCD
jgi:hypothetical protein